MGTRAQVCLATLIVGALLVPVQVDAGSGGKRVRFSGLESCFMSKVNAFRRSHGLRALGRDRQIGYVARNHARSIAARGVLAHDHNYTHEITNWRRLGQNTGRGNSCRALVRSFKRSSTHRHNMLGRWRYQAVGVARRNGKIYIQHVFESRRDPGNIY